MRSKGRPRPRTARGAAGSGSDDSDADRDPEPEGEVGRKLTWVPSDTADAVAAVAGQNGDVRVQVLFLSFFLSLSLSLSLSFSTCIYVYPCTYPLRVQVLDGGNGWVKGKIAKVTKEDKAAGTNELLVALDSGRELRHVCMK